MALLSIGLVIGLVALFVGYKLKLLAASIVAAFVWFLLFRVPFGLGMTLVQLPLGLLIGGLAGAISRTKQGGV